MAGSLFHIVSKDGSFTMSTIENMGDAHEALEDCYWTIKVMMDQMKREGLSVPPSVDEAFSEPKEREDG